jgi:predicted regulator of Ras-like GTPase activity (Roadblock/LC7/MglB family)
MTINPETIQLLQQEAAQLAAHLQGIRTVSIASQDGFNLASAGRNPLDAQRMAALSSSIVAIGAVVSQEAQLGSAKSITVNLESGFVYFCALPLAQDTVVLAVLAGRDAILAQVTHACAQIAKRLDRSMQ